MEEDKGKKGDIFESVWKFLSSVKLAIFVFIILATSSIIGTIVEQGAEPAKNISLLAKFFGDAAAPTVYNIFAKLGFMDMYSSWWFVSFLILFSINLIVCSLERLPKTWKFINRPLKPMSVDAMKSLPIRKEVALGSSIDAVSEVVRKQLKSMHYNFSESNSEESIQYYSQKGKYGRLGAYVVHISIILIFIGAIIGARFGFKAYLNLPEGTTSSVAFKSPSERIPLGFVIKCNWYNTSYYKDSMAPREFQSELVVIENGREVTRKVIEVNSPLTYKGIKFFQSSYGLLRGVLDEFMAGDSPSGGRMTTIQPTFSKYPNQIGRFILNVKSGSGKSTELWLRRGDMFTIPDTNINATIVGFSPTLDRDKRTSALGTSSYFKDQLMNPAVAIEIDPPDREPFIGWFLRGENTRVLPNANHEFTFIDFRGIKYTGLQVAKDPGVWLIYIACIIMAIGLYVSFFINHKKIWVNIANNKNSVRIMVGGSINRNRLNYEREIDDMVSHISDAVGGSKKK